MKNLWTICISIAFMLLVCGVAMAEGVMADWVEETSLIQAEIIGENIGPESVDVVEAEQPTDETAIAAEEGALMSPRLSIEDLRRTELACNPYCTTGTQCQGCYKEIYCGGGPAFCDSGYICDCR